MPAEKCRANHVYWFLKPTKIPPFSSGLKHLAVACFNIGWGFLKQKQRSITDVILYIKIMFLYELHRCLTPDLNNGKGTTSRHLAEWLITSNKLWSCISLSAIFLLLSW